MKIKKSHITISLLVLILTLTVTGIINQSFNPQNELEIPKTSAGEITVVSPENKTYTEPMSGYYPATYGFENEPHGTKGLDLLFLDEYYGQSPGAYTDIKVGDGPADGHMKYIAVSDSQGGTNSWGVHHIDTPQSSGTIEFYLWANNPTTVGSSTKRHFMNFRATDNTNAFRMMVYLSSEKVQYYDGSIWQDLAYTTPDTWYHHSISFDCEAGANGQFTWVVSDEQGSEIGRVDNQEFENDLNTIDEIYIGTHVSDYRGHTKWDAFGFSWDPDYDVGDNINEGLLLGYDSSVSLDWQGYSLDGANNKTIVGNKTIPMPSNGFHNVQVFGNDTLGTNYASDLRQFTVNYEPPTDITIITPENKTYTEPDSGYYPATYGFENDEVNEHTPYGWINEDATNTESKIVAEKYGHKNVIQQYDNSMDDSAPGTGKAVLQTLFNNQTHGTVEFYMACDNYAYGTPDFCITMGDINLGGVLGFQMYYQGTWRYWDGQWAGNQFGSYETNKFYHISIRFRGSYGSEYEGLTNPYTWKLYVDDVEYGIFSMGNSFDINRITLYTWNWGAGLNGYWDAFGFSWDPNYEIGDNKNEGLLLSYENATTLEWQGYSLDGQDNVTISGNYTIPVPVNGTHTIQVFGNDSIGTMYESNLRYFTYGTLSIPGITIISPTPNECFNSVAPDFQISISGVSINSTWYTIDGGLTNITFSGLTGTIDQTEWDILANGVVNLRFYINNTMGNSSYSEVSINKDTVAPIVTIISPLENKLFGKLSPSFDLSVVELNISSMWYSLDGGSTNITFQELTGTINQNEWDKCGNGTVSINFCVKDEADNEGSAQVTVRKEATPPLITINSPNDNDLFTTIAPSFDITIEEPDLDTTWYTLDDGVTNFIFSGLTGSINQAEWDKFGSGNITLKFYANDSYGFENFAQVTVQKDIGAPVITIISPEQGAVFSSIAPSFNITVFDSQLDSIWYTIDSGLTNITIVSTVGTIDQIEWDKKGEESVPFRFYANDTLGNTAYSEVIIIKDTVQPVITINAPDSYDILGSVPPSFDLSIVEINSDLVWYTLDSGSTNISIFSLSGIIDQTEWNKFGNGTVTINFYASDLAGNIGLSQVVVFKDIIAPLVSIHVPSIFDVFGNNAPSFSLSIVEPNLNLVWYTLDNGITNFSIGSLVGTIDQTEWNKFGNGTITLKFYANDLVGNEGFSQIIIYKDVIGPIITINSPEQDEIISAIAPTFNLTVIDSQLDSMWYTIDGGLTNIIIASEFGTIDQTEWNKKLEGIIMIRFYANDTIGNVAYSEVVVIKNVFYGIDPIELLTPSAYSQLTSNLLEFSWYSLDAGFGAVNFTLQVSNVSDFSFIIFQSADITETPIVTNFSVPLSITYGQFYWRVRPTYGNYNGSWSDYFLFTLHTNNYAPNLVLDDISPTEGTSSTIFRFTVVFSDLDNNIPEYVEILINGIPYSMEMVDPLDEDFTDGCIYQYLTLLTPSTTAYTISFECSDGAFQYSTLTYQGPLVEPDSTPSNNQGDNDLNSANTFAITMTLGITIGILIPFIVFAEIKVRKMKLGEKSSTKIKKKEIKS